MKQILLFTLMITGLLSADIFEQGRGPLKSCGTPETEKFNPKAYLEHLQKTDPDAYEQLLQQMKKVKRFNRLHIQQKKFWALRLENTPQPYQVTATLRKVGNLAQIWVEDESWNKGYVNNQVLDSLLDNLENRSGQNSIDPTKGIVEIDTMLLGQPPNIDGDGIIDFLILDIQDNFDSTNSSSSFIAGYFSPTDQDTSLSFSNGLDLMYLDAFPGIYFSETYRTEPVLSTTAHEFQHLIHYHYDRNESHWINEGLSELAGTYCGYGIDSPGLYLGDTNRSLVSWSNKVRDYARVNLWMLYCAGRFGLPFVKMLTQSSADSIQSFNLALNQAGFSEDLPGVYKDWVLANLINDTTRNPNYGYKWDQARGLRAGMSKLVYEYPKTIFNQKIVNWGVEYHRILGQDSLTVQVGSPFPEYFWVTNHTAKFRVDIPLGTSIQLPSFSYDSTYVMVLFSTTGKINYQYEADAKYSVIYHEISYDDQEINKSIFFQQTPAYAANRFSVPESNMKLDNVRFWSSTADYPARVHIFGQGGNALPSGDLVNPVSLPVAISHGWTEVLLNNQNLQFNKNEKLFVGIEVNDTTAAFGYDDTQPYDNQSYYRIGGSWRSLAAGGFPGDWMIRATFTRLISSDSIDTGEGPALQIAQNYPNPFSRRLSGTAFPVQLPANGTIRLVFYNVLGQKVGEFERSLLRGGTDILWNEMGLTRDMAAGIYFYRLLFTNTITGQTSRTDFKKMIILE